MTEIEIHEGAGDFNIVGTKNCTIFEYKNRSKILVWEMNWDSLMNYFVGKISKQPILYIQYFNELQKNLEQGTIDGTNIVEQFKPLLGSFSNAKYKLEVLEIRDSYHIIRPGVFTQQNEVTGENRVAKVIWAGGHPFVYAIQEANNEHTVAYYKSQIRSGVRPQLVLIKGWNSEIRIILDGHHKLEAYNATGVHPVCVQITKLTNYKVTDEAILTSFQKHKTEENKDLEIKLKTHLKKVNTDISNR